MDLTRQLEAAIRLIDRWLAYKVYIDRLPGLSLGIVYKDQVFFSRGYGYADIEQKRKATDTTCYRIASFSKIFTTIAILQLFEQGKLHIDENVQHYLPWCTSAHAPATARITIRQLLTHTSGLERDGDTHHWNDFQFPVLAQIQQHVAAGAMSYLPTTQWKYSNLGFALLGAIIQAVTGLSYEEYVNEHIVKRPGFTHTAPTLTDDIVKKLALGYSRNLPDQHREPFPPIETHSMASATGFSSNVRDLCQFMMALFDEDTRLLTDETKREMRRIQWLREGFDTDWCLGLETWKVNDRRIYGHAGSFQGYKSRFAIDAERKIGLVILANAIDAQSTDLANGALQIIDHIILHFETFEQQGSSVQHIEGYEGTFRSIWNDVTIAAVRNSLILYGSAAPNPVQEFHQLRYDRDNQFTMLNGDGFGNIGEPVSFVCNNQGVAQKELLGPKLSERYEYP